MRTSHSLAVPCFGAAFAVLISLGGCASATSDAAPPSSATFSLAPTSTKATSKQKHPASTTPSPPSLSAPPTSTARPEKAAAPTSAKKPRSTKRAVVVPGWKNCLAAPVVKPKRVNLDCVHDAELVKDITWSDWTQDQAVGTGTFVSTDCGERQCSSPQTWQVTVVLSDPIATPEGKAFSNASTY